MAKPRGPEPERLKIQGDWKDALRHALSKKRPPDGWPKPSKAPKSRPVDKKK